MKKLQDIKIKYILDIAIDMFLERSINEVTMKDIALKAEVSEMTLYRYFNKKQNLVIGAASMLSEYVFNKYFDLSSAKTGFEQISLFYNSYLKIFRENIVFYKFIRDFDSFLTLNNYEDISSYEKGVESFKLIFDKAYQVGIEDGTLKQIDDLDVFYFSTTHSILELCKKLSDKEILKKDLELSKIQEIKVLINIILIYIKK